MSDLTKEQIDLVNKINYLEEKLAALKKSLVNQSNNFDVWKKYGIKIQYKYLLSIQNPIQRFINTHLDWILTERYRIIDIDFLITAAEELIAEGKFSKEELEELKQNMMEINFESLIINW